jgi:hypothetical protein
VLDSWSSGDAALPPNAWGTKCEFVAADGSAIDGKLSLNDHRRPVVANSLAWGSICCYESREDDHHRDLALGEHHRLHEIPQSGNKVKDLELAIGSTSCVCWSVVQSYSFFILRRNQSHCEAVHIYVHVLCKFFFHCNLGVASL